MFYSIMILLHNQKQSPRCRCTEGKPICHVRAIFQHNTNLIAHNNNRLCPLKTYCSHTTTKTNLIAHNDSGKINLYKTLTTLGKHWLQTALKRKKRFSPKQFGMASETDEFNDVLFLVNPDEQEIDLDMTLHVALCNCQ